MTEKTKVPLCEAIVAEVEAEIARQSVHPIGSGAATGLRMARTMLRHHFAALSVEEVAKAICKAQFPGYSKDDIERVKDGTVLWHSYRGSAQAVMQLLRQEP